MCPRLQAPFQLLEDEFGLTFDRTWKILAGTGIRRRPETNTMPPPRVTGETGASRFASQDDIGSTRMTSRFIVAPLEQTDRGCRLAQFSASMLRLGWKCRCRSRHSRARSTNCAHRRRSKADQILDRLALTCDRTKRPDFDWYLEFGMPASTNRPAKCPLQPTSEAPGHAVACAGHREQRRGEVRGKDRLKRKGAIFRSPLGCDDRPSLIAHYRQGILPVAAMKPPPCNAVSGRRASGTNGRHRPQMC